MKKSYWQGRKEKYDARSVDIKTLKDETDAELKRMAEETKKIMARRTPSPTSALSHWGYRSIWGEPEEEKEEPVEEQKFSAELELEWNN